jgi:hypothetical protein
VRVVIVVRSSISMRQDPLDLLVRLKHLQSTRGSFINQRASLPPRHQRAEELSSTRQVFAYLSIPLPIDMERLEILSRRLRIRKNAVLDRPYALDEVVDPLEALVTGGLKEGVGLFGVVQMGVVFPFDVEALRAGERKDKGSQVRIGSKGRRACKMQTRVGG